MASLNITDTETAESQSNAQESRASRLRASRKFRDLDSDFVPSHISLLTSQSFSTALACPPSETCFEIDCLRQNWTRSEVSGSENGRFLYVHTDGVTGVSGQLWVFCNSVVQRDQDALKFERCGTLARLYPKTVEC